MQTILLTIHLLLALAIIGLVLLQRSEGGALGIGGGGDFMAGRSQANLLTRFTAVLGVCFFATSISLTLLARAGGTNSPLDIGVADPPVAQTQPASPLNTP